MLFFPNYAECSLTDKCNFSNVQMLYNKYFNKILYRF